MGLQLKWTPAEDDFIRANWLKMSDRKMGRHLCRGASGVSTRRSRVLGLHRGRPEGKRSAHDVIIAELWGSVHPVEIGKRLGVHRNTVYSAAKRLGLGHHEQRRLTPDPYNNGAVKPPATPTGYRPEYIAECRATAHPAELALILAMHREGVLRHA